MDLTRAQRRVLRRLPCHLRVPFALLWKIDNSTPASVEIRVEEGKLFDPRVETLAAFEARRE